MKDVIRIILADDHKMLREGFKTLLRKQTDIVMVAEADNGAMLLDKIEQHMPDVVITDIQMSNLNGIEACKIITERHPRIGVIALSSFDNYNLVVDMLDAGASGYLLKNADKKEIINAIRAVHEGNTYFCEHISPSLQKLLAQTRHTPYRVRSKIEFTKRELDIIALSSREFTNKEIGSILTLSTRTIESHKERMQSRVEAKNMVGVIMYAMKNNLLPLENEPGRPLLLK